MLTSAAFIFLVFTRLGSYKSNIANVLEFTFYSTYIPVEKKSNIKVEVWAKKYMKSSILG